MTDSAIPNPHSALQNLVPSLTSGFVLGVLEVATAISFTALIFAGALAPFLPQAIGYILVGTIIGSTFVAIFTSLPGVVGGIQDVPSVIMAVMSAAIVAAMPSSATAEEAFITVMAAIAGTTLITGLVFLVTGYFRLGGLARFLPYPVVGGFLAGTGWLLITGALGLMADTPADLFQLPALLQPQLIMRWLPGVLLAVLIMFLTKRVDHHLVLPALLILSLLLFFAVAWIGGYTVADLSAGGWLLGPFAGEKLWQPLTLAALEDIYWPAVFSQVMTVATIVLVSTISLLLNASGVELAVDRDINLDKDLRAAGAANIGASLFAGLVGYQQLSFSVLNINLGANRRLTGLVGVVVCGLALLAGASMLSLFPKMIIGALLLFLGFSFVDEWIVEGWSRLPRIDYAIVSAIFLATIFIGFLEAVALGLLLAVILFVVGYSRIDVVRHELSGETAYSRVVRPRHETEYLRDHGSVIYVLQLQGFIFFGTADSLLNRVQKRLAAGRLPRPVAVLLDFEHVPGIDSTAEISFSRMRHLAHARSFALVICGANERMRGQLEHVGLSDTDESIYYFDTLDHGLAWCEQQLLAEMTDQEQQAGEVSGAYRALFTGQMGAILAADERRQMATGRDQQTLVETMTGYFERMDVDPGAVIINQGAPSDSLYFLASGQVTARLILPEGGSIRLETTGSGHVIGELGFFLGGERTAEVVADEPSVLFRLTRTDLRLMEADDPQAVSLLHRIVAILLSKRVIHLTRTVQALQR